MQPAGDLPRAGAILRPRPGPVFMTFHYAGTGNVLANKALDPIARIPEYRGCAVKMVRAAPPEALPGG